MKGITSNNNKLPHNYKKILNKKDPIDNLILKLVKKGELKLEFVWLKEAPELPIENDRIPTFY